MGLHAGEPVRFAFAEAEQLSARLRATAAEVEAQAPARAAWSTEALRQWRGRHADQFRTDARTAAGDAVELATALRGAAGQLDVLAERAREEQHRRDRAAAWQAEQDRESVFEKAVEKVLGTDERPPYLVPPAPPAPVVAAGCPGGGRAR